MMKRFIIPKHHSQYDHHLGSVVHDLIGELRLSDVLPELLNPRASRLGRAVLVNHLFGEDHCYDDEDDDYDLDDCHSKFTERLEPVVKKEASDEQLPSAGGEEGENPEPEIPAPTFPSPVLN